MRSPPPSNPSNNSILYVLCRQIVLLSRPPKDPGIIIPSPVHRGDTHLCKLTLNFFYFFFLSGKLYVRVILYMRVPPVHPATCSPCVCRAQVTSSGIWWGGVYVINRNDTNLLCFTYDTYRFISYR